MHLPSDICVAVMKLSDAREPKGKGAAGKRKVLSLWRPRLHFFWRAGWAVRGAPQGAVPRDPSVSAGDDDALPVDEGNDSDSKPAPKKKPKVARPVVTPVLSTLAPPRVAQHLSGARTGRRRRPAVKLVNPSPPRATARAASPRGPARRGDRRSRQRKTRARRRRAIWCRCPCLPPVCRFCG